MHRPARDTPEREDHKPSKQAPPLPAGAPAAILALQRTAGNQAVTRLLAREPLAAAEPQAAPFPQDPNSPAFDLETIREETKAEILTAFTAFCDACDANVTAMKAAAKAQAEAAALFIDVATGFLAPAFAVAAGPTLVGRLSMKLAEKAVVEQADEKIKELITNADLLKAGFTGATKVVGDQLKRRSTQLFGEGPEEAFLDNMKTEFQVNAVALVGKVHRMGFEELLGVWAAYDPELANVNTYKATIKTLLDQFHTIETIGTDPFPFTGPLVNFNRRLYRVTDNNRLVILNDVSGGPAGLHGFVMWIPAHLEPTALAQEKEVHGGAPPAIALDQITSGAPDPPE
jgi:hypothetical protein